MKKPALFLLLTLAAFMGYAQTRPDTTVFRTTASSYRLASAYRLPCMGILSEPKFSELKNCQNSKNS